MPDNTKETFWGPLLFLLASVILGLALPGVWPNLSKTQAIGCSVVAVFLLLIAAGLAYRTHRNNVTRVRRGGAGGNATSIGDGNDVEGGRGGSAVEGTGGRGGNARAQGNRSRVKGGDGGAG